MAIPLITPLFRLATLSEIKSGKRLNKPLTSQLKLKGFAYMLTSPQTSEADDLLTEIKHDLNKFLAVNGALAAAMVAKKERQTALLTSTNYYVYADSEQQYKNMLDQFIAAQIPSFTSLQTEQDISNALEIVKFIATTSDDEEFKEALLHYQTPLEQKLGTVKSQPKSRK